MFDISKFLNEKKTQINLPVPIGGTVWRMCLSCDDACRRWTNRSVAHNFGLRCEMRSVCHTIAREPAEIKVTEDNLFNILTYWGEIYFATQEEAEKETKKVATDNIATMRKYGFFVTDHGYIGEN